MKWEELGRQRREEEERRQGLENQAEKWAKAIQLRAYIDAVEKETRNKNLNSEQFEQINKWLFWDRQHANRIDPLRYEIVLKHCN